MSNSRQEYYEQQRKQRLESIAREMGLRIDTPPGVLADYLEEHGRAELAREVREDLDPAAQPILSTKKRYPVGERHEYIFYLVKDDKSLQEQQQSADYWCGHYQLTAEERRRLAEDLAEWNRKHHFGNWFGN
jgi:hypothetical protein